MLNDLLGFLCQHCENNTIAFKVITWLCSALCGKVDFKKQQQI